MKRFASLTALLGAAFVLTMSSVAALAADQKSDKPEYDAIAESQKDDDRYEWTPLFDGKTLTNWVYLEDGGEDGATVKDVESLAGTIDELMAGRVDATLNAEVSINDYMREQPDADIKIVAFDEDVEQVGMIMPYGDASASLCDAINQALAELREEGKLAEISTKYFGMDITTNE